MLRDIYRFVNRDLQMALAQQEDYHLARTFRAKINKELGTTLFYLLSFASKVSFPLNVATNPFVLFQYRLGIWIYEKISVFLLQIRFHLN